MGLARTQVVGRIRLSVAFGQFRSAWGRIRESDSSVASGRLRNSIHINISMTTMIIVHISNATSRPHLPSLQPTPVFCLLTTWANEGVSYRKSRDSHPTCHRRERCT